MDNIIVEIMIGATGQITEFMVPARIPLKSLLERITTTIHEVYGHVAFEAENAVVIDMTRRTELCPEWTLVQSGVEEGSLLMIL